MKLIIASFIIVLAACTGKVTTDTEVNDADTVSIDNTGTDPDIRDTVYRDSSGISPKFYSNERFRDVAIQKIGDNTYLITGKGQIFEANFGWVIEDGHNELQQGNVMTNNGAPAWGDFGFKISPPKKDPNTTLHIILFESSPKDGSRQYELPIPIPD